ncbi:MAG: hypothetical protein LWX70_10305 [Sphingobacteriia bacterium]|nr:hypothetical protein [Sphingobacteriia bacterium]
MSKRSKQIAGHFLILIFVLYYANICFFYHTHIINGTTIVHSHFHTKNHTESGTHSDSELTLISALSTFQTLQPSFNAESPELILVLEAIIKPLVIVETIQKSSIRPSLRAPPFFN